MRRIARLAWPVVTALVQAATSWSVLLYFIPRAILRWQLVAELRHFGIEPLVLPGLVVLALTSTVNLWSRLTLAVRGEGPAILFTPPAKLVVTGPYAWIRNPIAASTILQGIGVCLYTGSALLIGYLVLLVLVWHLLIRPGSEHELQRRFGREYEFYRRSVRCWLPMRRRFRPRGALPPIDTSEMVIRSSPRRRRR
jgi:protein-S-isoprenylcysteine O-methyltransferase Ste14